MFSPNNREQDTFTALHFRISPAHPASFRLTALASTGPL